MDIKLSDEELNTMIEGAVQKNVNARIQRLVDQNLNGIFSEQNIRSIVYECITQKIEDRLVREALQKIDYKQLLLLVTDACVKVVTEHIKDHF